MNTQINSSKRRKVRKIVVYLVGTLLYCVGVASILVYPEYGRRTYVSENALMPGSSQIEYSDKFWMMAVKYSSDYRRFKQELSTEDRRSPKLADWMVQQMKELGLESAMRQDFEVNDGGVNSSVGYNVYGVLRADRCQGNEALVLSTRYNTQDDNSYTSGDSNGFGLSMSLLSLFQTRKWLSKDILFIASDGRFGDEGIKAWLKEYHLSPGNGGFPRGGSIQAAINIDLKVGEKFEHLDILCEGANGQLPNLDLINTVRHVAKRSGISDEHIALSDKSKQKVSLPREVPPFLATLFTFMLNQAHGVPTGDHGIFHIYHIDAITITNTVGRGAYHKVVMAKILEGSFRSLSNLIEHLHQSFYYYLLPAAHLYVPIGDYMISLGLIIGGFGLRVLIGVLTLKYETSTAHSLCMVLVFQVLGAIIYGLPYTIQRSLAIFQIPSLSLVEIMRIWLFTAAFLILGCFVLVIPAVDNYFVNGAKKKGIRAGFDAESYKTLASVPIILFVSSFSLLNFSFCLGCGIFMTPIYSLLNPSESRILTTFQVILLVAISPVTLFLSASYFTNIEVFSFLSSIVTQHQLFSNLIYPFLCLIYLPTNLAFLKFVTSTTK